MTRAEIQFIKSLADKRGRSEHGFFVAEGRKMVEEVLRSGFSVKDVFCTAEDFAPDRSRMISPKDMERISQLKTPSDVLAVVRMPHYDFDVASLTDRLTLALDRVQNPGNMGTIIRLADWFGISDIVCSVDSADCFSPKVVQATMGAVLRVKVHYTDLPPVLSKAADAGIPVYGTVLAGRNIYDEPLCPYGIIVMGNEGSGLSDQVASRLSHRLFIPPFPADRAGSESLNVAIATAVVCSEFRRRMSEI